MYELVAQAEATRKWAITDSGKQSKNNKNNKNNVGKKVPWTKTKHFIRFTFWLRFTTKNRNF